MKIAITANVPDELAREWLQHVRDFDVAHPGCHFEVVGETNQAIEDVRRALNIDPPLIFTGVLKRP